MAVVSGMAKLVSCSWIIFSVFTCGGGKRSGYLTIDFCAVEFWGLLIGKKEVFNQQHL